MPRFARRVSSLGRRLANDPVGISRRAWSRKAETLFRITRAVPLGARRPLARPVAAFGEQLSRTPGRHRVLPQLAFIARWATGDAVAAGELARELALSDHVTLGARRRLGQLAIAAGLREPAAAIVAAFPDDDSPPMELLRAKLDYEHGRYRSALEHATAAIEPGYGAAKRFADVVRGRLAVFDPAWQPELGARRLALERQRGKGTAGRIAHLLFASLPYNESGYSVRTQFVARAQRDAGLDPRLITRAGFPRSMGVVGAPLEELVGGLTYYRIAPNQGPAGSAARLIEATAIAATPLIRRLRPAALQPASNHIQAQIALALGAAAQIPVVYEVRGFWEETWASHPWHDEADAVTTDHYLLTRETETRCMTAAAAVVTLSETMRQEIVERGVPADHIVVVPNAVDVERFEPQPRDESLASSLGIGPAEPVVGYISSLTAYEGVRYLLEAAALLRGRGRSLKVVVVGDGPDRAGLIEAGARLGLDDGTLVMPGRVPHDSIRRYYSLIDIFVVPRTSDRVSRLVTPLKPFEAMAMERAVVVSEVPALREIVTPGETGMTFEAENAAALADVLGGLLDDEALRRRLGRQARDWVLRERTWAENGRRYRSLYERLGVA